MDEDEQWEEAAWRGRVEGVLATCFVILILVILMGVASKCS